MTITRVSLDVRRLAPSTYVGPATLAPELHACVRREDLGEALVEASLRQSLLAARQVVAHVILR